MDFFFPFFYFYNLYQVQGAMDCFSFFQLFSSVFGISYTIFFFLRWWKLSAQGKKIGTDSLLSEEEPSPDKVTFFPHHS